MANLWEGSGQVLVDGTGTRKRRPRGKGQSNPCECGNHNWAPLTKGFVTMVSPEFSHLLEPVNWVALKSGYATQSVGGKITYLHRIIGGNPKGLHVDHINFNKSDNRSENLRPATPTQNAAWKRKKSETKGVRKHHHRWVARICVNSSEIHLGSFLTKEEAMAAYDEAAIKHFGEFATLNRAA